MDAEGSEEPDLDNTSREVTTISVESIRRISVERAEDPKVVAAAPSSIWIVES